MAESFDLERSIAAVVGRQRRRDQVVRVLLAAAIIGAAARVGIGLGSRQAVANGQVVNLADLEPKPVPSSDHSPRVFAKF